MSGGPRGPFFLAGVVAMVVAAVLGVAAVGVGIYTLRPDAGQTVASSEREPTFEPLVRSDNPGEAWKEDVEEPQPESNTDTATSEAPEEEPPAPAPENPQQQQPEDPEQGSDPGVLPAVEEPDWPGPRPGEVAEANGERDYGALPAGAVLGLSIDRLGVRNAPVYGDDSPASLDRGVVHIPETSLPWSSTPERNTYLAAHRIGYPGTGSRMLFYNLDRLQDGDRIVLKKRSGKTFTYEVSEKFVVSPYDSWVMGRVRDRDMVTLQTCTPIPTFEKRLIVRADRV